MPTESVQRTHIRKKDPSYASLTQEYLSILQPYSTHPSRHSILPFEPLSCVSYQCVPYHTPIIQSLCFSPDYRCQNNNVSL
uniref:Uncharacterized protein n=2 Tax=Picea TaxID=3328 RepID=A0A101M5S5_PICGL|nr:hypothetical protein ABT39_MTgene1219 [Picea glauca]QHR92869.1 hypothetical protein Q903MT_gene6917 [Picea sitchensis]